MSFDWSFLFNILGFYLNRTHFLGSYNNYSRVTSGGSEWKQQHSVWLAMITPNSCWGWVGLWQNLNCSTNIISVNIFVSKCNKCKQAVLSQANILNYKHFKTLHTWWSSIISVFVKQIFSISTTWTQDMPKFGSYYKRLVILTVF